MRLVVGLLVLVFRLGFGGWFVNSVDLVDSLVLDLGGAVG